MIANISSSVITTGMQTHNNSLHRNGLLINFWRQSSSGHQYCRKLCTKPVLTCIVAIVLPITITLLLISGFMMQKNNLHEYAIYTFVIFCLAFIFPFILFFITVIINKIFRFYKRIDDNSREDYRYINDNMGLNYGLNYGHNHHNNIYSLPLIRHTRIREYENNIDYNCEPPYPMALEYRHLTNGVLVNVSCDPRITIDDSPPTYEMALLCPTVQLAKPLDINIDKNNMDQLAQNDQIHDKQ